MTLWNGYTKVGSTEIFQRNPFRIILGFRGFGSGGGGGGGLGRLGGLSFGRTGHSHGFKILDSFTVSLLNLLQLGLKIFRSVRMYNFFLNLQSVCPWCSSELSEVAWLSTSCLRWNQHQDCQGPFCRWNQKTLVEARPLHIPGPTFPWNYSQLLIWASLPAKLVWGDGTPDSPDGSLDNFTKVWLVLGHGDQFWLHLCSDCLQ